MSSLCRVCNAEIVWGETPDGARIPIDERETVREGDNRWRMTDQFAMSGRPLIEAVNSNWPGETAIDHRVVCQQPRVV